MLLAETQTVTVTHGMMLTVRGIAIGVARRQLILLAIVTAIGKRGRFLRVLQMRPHYLASTYLTTELLVQHGRQFRQHHTTKVVIVIGVTPVSAMLPLLMAMAYIVVIGATTSGAM